MLSAPLSGWLAPRVRRRRVAPHFALLALVAAPPVAKGAGDDPPRNDDAARAADAARVAARFDAAIDAGLAEQGLAPSPPVDDATWLRRLSLDLRGVIPSAEEAAAFRADRAPARREARIEAFLRSDEFGANFANAWSNLLLETATAKEGEQSRMWLEPWLAAEFRGAASFATIARGLVAGTSDSSRPGAAGLAITYRDTLETLSGTVASALLGIQIQCAQCHDDPGGRFEQVQFNRFTGFFADVVVDSLRGRSKSERLIRVGDVPAPRRLLEELRRQLNSSPLDGGTRAADAPDAPMAGPAPMAAGDGGPAGAAPVAVPTLEELVAILADPERADAWCAEHLVEGPLVDALRPQLGTAAAAALQRCVDVAPFRVAGHLDGAPREEREGRSRRDELADWMVAAGNPWFARNAVNRFVAHFLGRGLVEPVDDLTNADDVVAPGLLDELAREFEARGTDVRWLCGVLVRTRAYARGPATGGSQRARRDAERRYASHPLRPFTAEQALASLLRFRPEPARAGERAARRSDYTREDRLAFELKRFFGELGGAGRGGAPASIPQALFLMNGPWSRVGPTLRESVPARALADAGRPLAERLAPLWLATLSRPPAAAEVAEVALALDPGLAPDEQLELLFWALVNSAEFHTHR